MSLIVQAEKPEIIMPRIYKGDYVNRWVDFTNEQYHSIKDHVHSSSLPHIIKSPWAYLKYMSTPTTVTKSMSFGRISHMVILEGPKFLKRYVIEPVHSGFTQDGKPTTSANALSVKQAKKEWQESLPPGSEIVTQEEFDDLRWMIDSVTANKDAMALLSAGKPEAQGVWLDPATGLPCIMQVDFKPDDPELLVEFKTTTDCAWESFRKTVEKLRYDVQFHHYSEGCFNITGTRPRLKVWITTESSGSYETRVHEVHSTYMEGGKIDYIRAMRTLANCIEHNSWPQGQNVSEEAPPPTPWYASRYENMKDL